jgi:hypothetical protein
MELIEERQQDCVETFRLCSCRELTPMSEVGQKRKCPGSRGRSVLPSGADIVSLRRQVRLVPLTDSCTAATRSFIRSPRRAQQIRPALADIEGFGPPYSLCEKASLKSQLNFRECSPDLCLEILALLAAKVLSAPVSTSSTRPHVHICTAPFWPPDYVGRLRNG